MRDRRGSAAGLARDAGQDPQHTHPGGGGSQDSPARRRGPRGRAPAGPAACAVRQPPQAGARRGARIVVTDRQDLETRRAPRGAPPSAGAQCADAASYAGRAVAQEMRFHAGEGVPRPSGFDGRQGYANGPACRSRRVRVPCGQHFSGGVRHVRRPLWLFTLRRRGDGSSRRDVARIDGPRARGADAPGWAHVTVTVGSVAGRDTRRQPLVGDRERRAIPGRHQVVERPGRDPRRQHGQRHGQRGQRTPGRGERAMLDLRLTSVHGARVIATRCQGGTEAIVAGSTRARNLGAIAAATAAGALVAAAAVGRRRGQAERSSAPSWVAVRRPASFPRPRAGQVLLKQGMALTFTTSEAVAVRSSGKERSADAGAE